MKIEGIAERILISKPYLALRMNNYIFRETTYGIVKRLHFLLNHIEKKRQELGLEVEQIRILDVGCGTGVNVTIPLANIGYSIVGLDTDRATVMRAQQIARKISNIEFRHAKLEKSHFPEQFHVVICSEVFEHLKEPQVLVKQMRNVLNDLGLLLVTVPNGYGYFELESAIDQRFPMIANLADNIQQRIVRRFGSDALKQRHSKERTKEHCKLACPSLDCETTHCNKFTYHKIKRIIQDNNYKIIDFHNRTFLAGNIINVLLRESDMLLNWNCAIADLLPKSMCSGWLIAAIKPK